MNETDTLRALETLNARSIELRASAEYAAGVRQKNLRRLTSDLSPAGIKKAFHEFQKFRAFSKAPRHPEVPNLSPSEWKASLRTGDKSKRVVVYSCIVGNYDLPLAPVWQAPNISYVLFLEGQDASLVDGWEVRPIPEEVRAASGGSATGINRYIKFHPYELFADDFDASIYVDGNIQPVSDLSYYADLIRPEAGIALHHHRVRTSIADEVQACKALDKGDGTKMDAQVARYVAAGFPLDYGLLECNVIASDLHSELGRQVFADWWEEFTTSGSGRDQLALPYVLWQHGVPFEAVATMGRNAYADTKIFIASHN
jgi:hypothetical protein